jgi:transposase InsO family protein
VAVESERVQALVSQHMLHNNILYRRALNSEVWRACLPRQLVRKVVIAYHEVYGHFGARKVTPMIAYSFTWNNMDRIVRKVIASCELCQKSKHRNRKHQGEMQPIVPDGPGELVCIDLYGPLPRGQYGMEYVLVVVDAFSKFVALYALRRATARAVIRQIQQYYLPLRRFRSILSDHGSQFTSKLWLKFLAEEGIQIRYSSIRNPQSNPAERIMRELGRMLRAYCHENHSSWVKWLPKIANWFNVTIHSSTGYTPYEVQFGQRPTDEIQQLLQPRQNSASASQVPAAAQVRVYARQNMRRAANARKRAADTSAETVQFAVGDKVLVRAHRLSSSIDKVAAKFFLLYEGPYSVSKVLGSNAYLVRDGEGQELGPYNARSIELFRE